MKVSTSPVNLQLLCPHGEHWYNVCNLLDVARVADGDGDETEVGGGVSDGGDADEEGEEEEVGDVVVIVKVVIADVEVHHSF